MFAAQEVGAVIRRLIHGRGSRLSIGAVVALVVIVGVVLAVVPASTSTARVPGQPKPVEIVGPNGVPVNVVNGSLSAISAPSTPFQFQDSLHLDAGSTTVVPVEQPIPNGKKISISSITLTCNICTSGSGAPQSVDVILEAENAPDCSTPVPAYLVADMLVSNAEPTTEFTYPTPRTVPAGFTPSGPWCLHAAFYAGGAAANAALTIDGSQG
jgi:hypothetical protein